MKINSLVLALLATLLMPRVGQAQNPCAGNSSYSGASTFYSYIASFSTVTTSRVAADNRGILGLVTIPDTLVSVVTDSTRCAQALTAYNLNAPSTASTILVLKLGPRFVVADTVPMGGGEKLRLIAFDTTWVVKGSMGF